MQSVIESLKAWQPHPFVDHFTVALILIGILTDLVASIFSARLWIRYMALTLMIAGAIGAVGSNVTGGWEAGRVWDSVNGAGKTVLERHAWWGDVLPWVFGGLALWRLGVQSVGFIAASRPIYLLVAIARRSRDYLSGPSWRRNGIRLWDRHGFIGWRPNEYFIAASIAGYPRPGNDECARPRVLTPPITGSLGCSNEHGQSSQLGADGAADAQQFDSAVGHSGGISGAVDE